MAFEDKRLQCVECGAEFVWTAGEQAFYSEKQFANEPRRCPACRSRHGSRAPRGASAGALPQDRVETTATCSACGRTTTLPFRPAQGRPVYCRDCYQHRKRHRT